MILFYSIKRIKHTFFGNEIVLFVKCFKTLFNITKIKQKNYVKLITQFFFI